jgi:N-acetylglucosaminyldiphosphoundecaprenol N-acetyl-beta-D-mannosaminyltransferase
MKIRQKVKLLNGVFDRITLEESGEWAIDFIKMGKKGYVCTVNVAILMMMRSDRRLANFVDRASLVVADGQPLIWASRWLARPLPERVAGVDLMATLAAHAAREQLGIYLMGAKPHVVTAAVSNLKSMYPGLIISGFDSGYFTSAEAIDRVNAIRRSGASILFVGMGVPRQEYFLDEHWSELGVNLAIGVGGSFEIFAKTKKRAPVWVQECGLEWFYRLLQEPRRLWKRYAIANTQFLYLLAKEILHRRESFKH